MAQAWIIKQAQDIKPGDIMSNHRIDRAFEVSSVSIMEDKIIVQCYVDLDKVAPTKTYQLWLDQSNPVAESGVSHMDAIES